MPVKMVSRDAMSTPTTKTLRLFCLPYAAGSARIFGGWHRDLPRFVEVCPLELPGHGRRSREEPIDDLELVMADLLDRVLPRTDLPFAVFGHDYGALLGFELARRLEHRHGMPARHLFVSAMRAPVWPQPSDPISEISDERFRELLRSPTGTSGDVLENDSMMEFAIRVLRADFRVADNYRYERREPPSCPVTAFRGRDDAGVSSQSVRAWNVCTSGPFDWHEIPGGHYFLHRAKDLLLHRMSEQLGAHRRQPALPVP